MPPISPTWEECILLVSSLCPLLFVVCRESVFVGVPSHFPRDTSVPSCPLLHAGEESLQKVCSENLTKMVSPLMDSVSPFSVFWATCPLCPCLLLI